LDEFSFHKTAKKISEKNMPLPSAAAAKQNKAILWWYKPKCKKDTGENLVV